MTRANEITIVRSSKPAAYAAITVRWIAFDCFDYVRTGV